MKFLKFILYGLLFFLIGEAFIRIDMAYDLLNKAPKIDIKIDDSELKTKVVNGSFEANPNQIRILILGDSYIYGGGIKPSEKFSKKLYQLLQKSNATTKEILILDVSRASNNTLDNFNSFEFYQDKFNPQFIFWAYNFNDILDNLKRKVKNENESEYIRVEPPKRVAKKSKGIKKIMKELYSYSELTRYISSQVQNELKFNGIVLPVGDFHYLTKEAYQDGTIPWKDTQTLLSEVSIACQSSNSQLIIYKMPEFNLLNKPNLFVQVDKAMFEFCNSLEHAKYIDGINDFKDEDGNLFMLSKYDGHPNEKAHSKIAETVSKLIEEQISTKNNLD